MQLLLTQPGSSLLIAAIMVASAGFVCYHYLSTANVVKEMLRAAEGTARQVIFQRMLGFAIFGILPVAILLFSGISSFAAFGIKYPVSGTWVWIAILSAVVLVMNFFNASGPANLAMYPQIREKDWSVKMLILSALSWVLYLLGYEFLFRGFLLFAALPVMGLWPAIVLNTAVYMLVHLPKGIKETLGAIPLGVLLCYLTVQTGSIWVAVVVHIVMALSNEWLSLRAQPDMGIKNRIR